MGVRVCNLTLTIQQKAKSCLGFQDSFSVSYSVFDFPLRTSPHIAVGIFTRFFKKTEYKQRVKGEYENYSRITDDLGVVSLKDDTALFSSTKIYSIFCDFAFSYIKEQNSTLIRAPPHILKSNHFKMNGGLLIVNLFY